MISAPVCFAIRAAILLASFFVQCPDATSLRSRMMTPQKFTLAFILFSYMKSRPAASILAQQGGSLLKFDFENRSPVFLTLLPQAQNKPKVHSRAETGTALGCASREFHPSEDLSELPPLRVAVAGQEYQRWCCHRKTGRPRPAFWTNGPANHLFCRIDADFCTGGSSRVSPMSLANSLSLHGTPADVFPLLDMYLRRFRTGLL